MALKASVGKVFGRLTVIGETISRRGRAALLVQCECGSEKTVMLSDLTHIRSPVTSCGCLHKERATASATKHGMRYHKAYRAWQNMVRRCTEADHPRYGDYGGRGITVCSEWVDSFAKFWEDMSAGYSTELTLDRRDNSLGYSARNCRWASREDQGNNKRNNVKVTTPKGIMTVAEAAREYNISWATLRGRVKRGVPNDKLLLPVRSNGT